MNDFYIGYLSKAPQRLARFVRVLSIALLVAAAASAVTITALQSQFPASVFEFGQHRVFEGVIQSTPYPTLVLRRPGNGASASSRYLLVGAGKHGADSLVAPYDGQPVRLKGMLIYRDGKTMIEVLAGSITHATSTAAAESSRVDIGPVELTGEIVDSKCYLGVMNPGSGKVHHDCAVRCLSGGVPPNFIVADFQGAEAVFLLTDPAGNALPVNEFRKLVAKPVRVQGNAFRLGDTLFLAVARSGIAPAL